MESNRLFHDNIAAGYSMHNQLEAWRLQDELARFHSFGSEIPLYGISTGETQNTIPESAAGKSVSAFLIEETRIQEAKRASNERLFPKTTPKRRSVTPINLLLRSDPNYLGFDRLTELNASIEDASSEDALAEDRQTLQNVRETAANPSFDAPSPLKVFYDENESTGEPTIQDTIPEAQSLFRRIDPPHKCDIQAAQTGAELKQGQKSQSESESESLLFKFADRFLDPTQTNAEPERVELYVASDVQDQTSETALNQNANPETVIAFPTATPSATNPVTSSDIKPCVSTAAVPEAKVPEIGVASAPQNIPTQVKESFLVGFRWPLCYLGIMALAAGGGIIGYSVFTKETTLYNTGLAIVSAGAIGLGCASALYASRLIYQGLNALFSRSSRVSANPNESVSANAEPVVDTTPAVESLEQQVLQLQSVLEQMQRKAA